MNENTIIEFNLGLENNPYDAKQCLEKLDRFGELLGWKVVTSVYEGNPERTLVVKFDSVFFPIADLVSCVRVLAMVTTQDCVAFTADGHGYVIGKTSSDDIKFDANYFVKL